MRVPNRTTTETVPVFNRRNFHQYLQSQPQIGIPVHSFRTHRNYSRNYKKKIIHHYSFTSGHILAHLVQALGYKPNDRESDSR